MMDWQIDYELTWKNVLSIFSMAETVAMTTVLHNHELTLLQNIYDSCPFGYKEALNTGLSPILMNEVRGLKQ